MRQLGLSPSESSTIFGITWFLTAIARPGFGFMADKWQKHKQLLMLCLIFSSILFGCLLLIPPTDPNPNGIKTGEIRFFCEERHSYLAFCDNDQSCQNLPKSPTGNSTTNLCLFTCEIQNATSSTCISGTGPQGNIKCLNAIPNSSLLEIQMELGGFPLSNEGTEIDACHYVTVVSVYDNKSDILYDVRCSKNTSLTCRSQCPFVDEESSCPTPDQTNKFSRTFWLFAFMYLTSNIVFTPIPSLIDALTYSHLGEERGKWGPQRVWGTIGFALFGVTAGFAMDAVKRNTGDINYAWCFGFFILHNLSSTVSAYFYKTSDHVKCSQPVQKLGQLLKNIEVLSLYSLVFVLGIFTGIIESLRFWHLQNLGASQLLLGMCLVMSCLPEIVVMFVMEYIIKLVGEHMCLYVACVAYACRFLGYSLLQNPWFVMLVEVLNGITYGVMYGAASAYGSRLTPEGMHGTMQAMLTTLHFGFGKGMCISPNTCFKCFM